jgi:hypothetical protein
MRTFEPRGPRSRNGAGLRRAAMRLGLLAAALPCGAQAARIDYQLEMTLLHSDNIDLSEDDEISENVLIPRLVFDVREEGATLELQARGAIERRVYLENRFPDETRGEFAGQLNWALSPERLHFVVEDYLSHESTNIREGRYPGNLQRVNVLLAGPSLYARLGQATGFRLDLRGVESDAEEAADFDARRYSAAVSLRREMSATATGSLNYNWVDVDFDDPASVDYRRHDGFVRFEGRLRELAYELELGGSRVERTDAAGDSIALARLLVEWQATPQSRLRFRARQQFGDEVQGIIFRLSDPEEDLVADPVEFSPVITGGVYRLRHAELDYRFTGERAGLRVRPLYRRFRYLDESAADRDERGVLAQASYRLGRRTDVFVNGSLRRREFLLDGEEQRDHVYGLGFEHRLTRNWGLRGEVFRNDRDSNVADSRYSENGFLLTIWWKR